MNEQNDIYSCDLNQTLGDQVKKEINYFGKNLKNFLSYSNS